MEFSSTIPVLEDRKFLIGVTGSIAAYKSVDLVSALTQAGAVVEVILTEAAQKFVSPLTFQSVSGRRSYTDQDLWGEEAHILHVGLAHSAELFAVAPATANTLAKMAHGLADSLLTLTALAVDCPRLVAPAMDAGMYEQSSTQANLSMLQEQGVEIIGPTEGRMASGLIGLGRMVEPSELLGWFRQVIGRSGPLAGRKVVVTAGGTQEALDPVRVIANRSSGRQGFALAQAAIDRGASVTLIAGPTTLQTPMGVERNDVTTAAEMKDATLEACQGADSLLMAAAVADFRPSKTTDHKIKRREGIPKVVLEPTDDILEMVARRSSDARPSVIVGFAAESQDLVDNARKKMEEKGLSLIVANDITSTDAGFEVETNRATILDPSGKVEELPLMVKSALAERILDLVVEMLVSKKTK